MAHEDPAVRARVAASNIWHLATVNRDGSPHVSPMWVDVEGDRVVIRGRAVEFIEGDEADRCIDRLAKKYAGTDHFAWRIPGERRVKILVEPTSVRHVVGVEPFRPGVLGNP
ncbi:pyridoxamine 5'-phosphate oxidase family protein [Amycolatopsis plumensis]|uniref:Pyridoxamine 5'-phosphate oxidase family protein n=2 Tax=Amycolatopsis plumensis TaxID=236508 RepID=A0ABV5UIZ7_9PSEU